MIKSQKINFLKLENSLNIQFFLIFLQTISFAILYSVWGLPETILIRHIFLGIGATIGLYEIYCYRTEFFQKKAISIWLLFGLFLWASTHLMVFNNDFHAQYEEYTSIWKRSALGAIFGVGFGVALVNGNFGLRSLKILWNISLFGLLFPSIFYILKYAIKIYSEVSDNFLAPDYLKLYYSSAPFYLPKTYYVCFLLPVFNMALLSIYFNIKSNIFFKKENFIYLSIVLVILWVFDNENIKNGIIYSFIFIALFVINLILNSIKINWKKKLPLAAVVVILGAIYLNLHAQKNDSWRSLVADAKIALDTERTTQWQYRWQHNGAAGYPVNELGTMVSITNYERISWAKEGLGLAIRNPLGYGLIERSFGRLEKVIWPNSELHQTHSGWIDLALGVGLPGVLMILGAIFIAVFNLQKSLGGVHQVGLVPWYLMGLSSMFAILAMWCTTELSQRVFFDVMIFWTALSSGLSMKKD